MSIGFSAKVDLDADVNVGGGYGGSVGYGASYGGDVDLDIGVGVGGNVGISAGVGVGGGASVGVGVGYGGGVSAGVSVGGGYSSGVSASISTPTVHVSSPGVSVGVSIGGSGGLETEYHLCGTPLPVVSSLKALIIFTMNLGSPGAGTGLVGCLGKDNINCYHFICMGMLQYYLAPLCCLGMIWALCFSCKFKELADTYEATGQAPAENLAVSWPHEAVSFRTIQSNNP